MRLIGEQVNRAAADIEHQNVRFRIQSALLEPSKSTSEIVTEALNWAKAQSTKTDDQYDSDDDDDTNFNRKWDRRAVAMAAALVARDYRGSDRMDSVAWARSILETASAGSDEEYHGNDQIQYNIVAIAALGWIALFLEERHEKTRDAVLKLASKQHIAVVNAICSHFPEFGNVDPRLPRSIIRIAMTSAIHPRRGFNDRQDRARKSVYQRKVDRAIAAEKSWLDGVTDEPTWPTLPNWHSRARRRILIGRNIDEDESPEEAPQWYVDEHSLGAVIGHLVRMTVADLQPWLVDLTSLLMRWTDEANGPHGENDRDRDNRPHTWNGFFLEFVGILSVALPHSDVERLFLEPIVQFKDESFHDSMAAFLRGFDRAVLATDTKKPENPIAVRAIFAERMQRSWNFRRFQREKGFTSETHAGDAMSAMFFQPPRFATTGRPTVPPDWAGLEASMPTLTMLVTGASSSGYFVTLFLNLIEPSPRAILLPFVVHAVKAWCSAWGVDTNFWSEKDVGGRVCGWLDRTLTSDPASLANAPTLADDLLQALDVLVRSGVAQAREIEERVVNIRQVLKSA